MVEFLALKQREILLHVHRWVLEAAQARANYVRGKIKLIGKEFVRVLRLNVIWFEGIRREIFPIERHNGVSPAKNGSRSQLSRLCRGRE